MNTYLVWLMYKKSIVTPNTITLKMISTRVHLDADVQKRRSVTAQVCINSFDARPFPPWSDRAPCHHPPYRPGGKKKNRAPWRSIAWFVELPETGNRIRDFLYVAKGEESMYNNLQKFTK